MRFRSWSFLVSLCLGLILAAPRPISAADEKLAAKEKQKPQVKLATDAGDIVLELWPDVAPGHVANFMSLVNKGFYNGLTFHRVVPGFVIQGGCPKGDGSGDPGYSIKAEFSNKPHERGTLSMARRNNVDSAGCQFFICLDRERCGALDNQYTVFGRVISGMEAVDKIVALPLAKGTERPIKPPKILKALVLAKGEIVAPESPIVFTQTEVRSTKPVEPAKISPAATAPAATQAAVDPNRSTPEIKTRADDAFFESMKGILATTPEQASAAEQERRASLKREEDDAKVKQNLADAEKFLAANKTAPGVVTTPSGLQYKVLQQGSGAKPGPASVVRVHYKGTLIDGKVFDSSYDRKAPSNFPLNAVIKGWTEGLQLMNAGGRSMFWVPPSLGYGAAGAGGIAGNELLIFEVELIEVVSN